MKGDPSRVVPTRPSVDEVEMVAQKPLRPAFVRPCGKLLRSRSLPEAIHPAILVDT